ncbi:hypothetical protein H2200_005435 [Cladophialophora chaetospira]|uniref:Ribokinase n=1 Tax=Cladophialophora chaetospira TaxID=386627 RepID=A0AA38XBZ6_9EURO|nr:hypothetical protein H2200_005435 [Cladophialophora chaetospira]
MVDKPSIAIVGSVNIDFAVLVPRIPGPGETLTAVSLDISAGGKGANQAVACGRAAFVSPTVQDVKVDLIGAVGKGDPYYSSLVQPLLAKSGVGTKGIEELEDTATGTAIVLVDHSDAQNRILVVPSANAAVSDVSKLIDVIGGLYKHEPTVVVLQGEIPRTTVLGLLRRLNASERTAVVFNPAPLFPEGIPIDSVKGLAALVVNETEWLQLVLSWKIGHTEEPTNQPSDANIDQKHLDQYTTQVHETTRISIILVTLGSRGVYYSLLKTTGGAICVCGLIPAKRVDNLVDTTAAGDTFIGYFAVELSRHLASKEATLKTFDIRAALGKANSAAALARNTVSHWNGNDGISCDGLQLTKEPDILDQQLKEISAQQPPPLPRPVKPLFEGTPEELRGLEYWISETGPTIANYGPSFDFWCRVVPMWAWQSQVIRHLLVAATQFDEHLGLYRTASASQLGPVAISHYLAAIKNMATATESDKFSVTLAGVLGWVFETMQDNHSAGQIHLSAASRLLSELEAAPGNVSQSSLELIEQMNAAVHLVAAYAKAECQDALEHPDGPLTINTEGFNIPVAHSLADWRDALLESTARYLANDQTRYAARAQRLYVKNWHRSLRHYCSRSKEESHLHKKTVQMLFNLGLAFLPEEEVGCFSYQATPNAIRHLLDAFERADAENQKNKLGSENGDITETIVMALELMLGQLQHEELDKRAGELLHKLRKQFEELNNGLWHGA